MQEKRKDPSVLIVADKRREREGEDGCKGRGRGKHELNTSLTCSACLTLPAVCLISCPIKSI